MSAAVPPSLAVVLPPREGFGPRRARGIGLMIRHLALASTAYRTVVYGSRQHGPVFLDVTFRLVTAPFYALASSRTRYVMGLIRSLRSLRPALIEVHAEPKIAMALQRVFPSVPVVFVAHEDPSASRFTRAPARRVSLFSRVARVVTVSEWLRDLYVDGVSPPPTHAPMVVPPPVDLTNLQPSSATLDATGVTQAQRRSRVILFVGRLVAEKGADIFVSACTAALPSLPGWRAEIIGGADYQPARVETTFIRTLEATAEAASISLMGYRDHPDAMAAMARAAIVVVPSRAADPSGRVVLEAMANGAAVICSPGGAVAEIGGDAVIYAEGDAIAQSILVLGGDPRRIAAMAEAGRRRAGQFDLARIGRLVDAQRARIIADWRPK
jgi:UDP-glucose:(glucosyl)LPS alpha-1,2-glucosyltransferase